jgi:hypothetical protein
MTGIRREDEQLLGSQEGQLSLGKPKGRLRYIIQMHLRRNDVCLAKERGRWRALVSAVMNLSFAQDGGNVSNGFIGADQLRGVGQWVSQRHAGCIANSADHVFSVSQKTGRKGGGTLQIADLHLR